MDPIVLIPYTIFLLTTQALWTKDEFVPVKHCYAGARFKHNDSVFICAEEQRLQYKPGDNRYMIQLRKEQCVEDECD